MRNRRMLTKGNIIRATRRGAPQSGTPAGFGSEHVAGFTLERMAGFVGIRLGRERFRPQSLPG
jgi:hypothetical protein